MTRKNFLLKYKRTIIGLLLDGSQEIDDYIQEELSDKAYLEITQLFAEMLDDYFVLLCSGSGLVGTNDKRVKAELVWKEALVEALKIEENIKE